MPIILNNKITQTLFIVLSFVLSQQAFGNIPKNISIIVKNLGQSSGKVNSVNAGLGASRGRTTTRETVLTR